MTITSVSVQTNIEVLQNGTGLLTNQGRTLNKKNCTKFSNTVKLGNKERFDKEQIGIKEPFPVTNLPFTS